MNKASDRTAPDKSPIPSWWKPKHCIPIALVVVLALGILLVRWWTAPVSPTAPISSPALQRDRARILAFAGTRRGIALPIEVDDQLSRLVMSGDMKVAWDEFTGAFDSQWRTPVALAREFIFRVGRPGDLELMLASAVAQSLREEADRAIQLVSELETVEAVESVEEILWSDDAVRALLLDGLLSEPTKAVAEKWGFQACAIIAESDQSQAVQWMERASRDYGKTTLEDACRRVAPLRSLVGSATVASSNSGLREQRELLKLERAKYSAQAAAVTLSSIAEARLVAIQEIQNIYVRITPTEISSYLDSMTGLIDSPTTAGKLVLYGNKQVVAEGVETYVLKPAGFTQLKERAIARHDTALRAIPNRILDECDGASTLATEGDPSSDQGGGNPATSFDDLSSITAVDLAVGTAGVVDVAVTIAAFFVLIPEPTFATKVVGVAVAVGPVLYDLSQVTEVLKRRALTAAQIHNSIARSWIGTTGLGTKFALTDGTVVDQVHPATDGILFANEARAFLHYRDAVKAALSEESR